MPLFELLVVSSPREVEVLQIYNIDLQTVRKVVCPWTVLRYFRAICNIALKDGTFGFCFRGQRGL